MASIEDFLHNLQAIKNSLVANNLPDPVSIPEEINTDIANIISGIDTRLNQETPPTLDDLQTFYNYVVAKLVEIYKALGGAMVRTFIEATIFIRSLKDFITTFYPKELQILKAIKLPTIQDIPNSERIFREENDFRILTDEYQKFKDIPAIVAENFPFLNDVNKGLYVQENNLFQTYEFLLDQFPKIKTHFISLIDSYSENLEKWGETTKINTPAEIPDVMKIQTALQELSKLKPNFEGLTNSIKDYQNVFAALNDPSHLTSGNNLTQKENIFLAKLVSEFFKPNIPELSKLSDQYKDNSNIIELGKIILQGQTDPVPYINYLIGTKVISTEVFKDISRLPLTVFIESKDRILKSLFNKVPIYDIDLYLLDYMVAGFITHSGTSITQAEADYSVDAAIASAKPVPLSFKDGKRTVTSIIQDRLLPKHSLQQSLVNLRGIEEKKVKLASTRGGASLQWALPNNFTQALDKIDKNDPNIIYLLNAYAQYKRSQDPKDYDVFANLYAKELGHSISSDAF